MVPLVALPRMHQPSSPLYPPTPFRPNDLSTSSLSLSLFSPPSRLRSPPPPPPPWPSPRFNAVLQFQPHFCASLSPRANSDNMSQPYQTAALIGVRIFFQAIQSFSQEPARVAPCLCMITHKSVKAVATHFYATRRIFNFFVFSLLLSPPLSLSFLWYELK